MTRGKDSLMVRLALFTAGWLTAMAMLGPAPSHAQLFGVSVSAGDEQLFQELHDRRTGAVWLAVRRNKEECSGADFASGRNPPIHLDTGIGLYRDIKKVPPGEYQLLRVSCGGRPTEVFNGPHARFVVRPGEVVNIGSLDIAESLDGLAAVLTLRAHIKRSISEFSAPYLVFIRKRFPRTSTLMVTRPMTLIGPAESAVQFRHRSGH